MIFKLSTFIILIFYNHSCLYFDLVLCSSGSSGHHYIRSWLWTVCSLLFCFSFVYSLFQKSSTVYQSIKSWIFENVYLLSLYLNNNFVPIHSSLGIESVTEILGALLLFFLPPWGDPPLLLEILLGDYDCSPFLFSLPPKHKSPDYWV